MDTSNFLALVVGFMVANFLLYLIKESDDDNGGGDGGMMVPSMAQPWGLTDIIEQKYLEISK